MRPFAPRRPLSRPARRIWAALSAPVGLALLLSACASDGPPEPPPAVVAPGGTNFASPSADGKITMTELDQQLMAYADRYTAAIASAFEQVERANPSAQARRDAHLTKLLYVTAIYDIAAGADPFSKLLDTLMVVTLQSAYLIDEDRAEQIFGDRARPVIEAILNSRQEIWELASRVMTPAQLQTLDLVIWDWRRKNPGVELVSMIRFKEVSQSRARALVTEVRRGGGFLAPIDEATRAVDEARRFGERAMFLAQRAPFLVNWQAEAMANDLLLKPEIVETVAAADSLTKSAASLSVSADRAVTVVDNLPNRIAAEREALFDELKGARPDVSATLTEYSAAADKTRELMNSASTTLEGLTKAISAADGVIARVEVLTAKDPGAPAESPGKAFDISEYGRVAGELTSTVREMNTLLASSESLLNSEAWTLRLRDVNKAAEDRVIQASTVSKDVVDHIFRRSVQFLALAFVAACLLLVVSRRLIPRPAGV